MIKFDNMGGLKYLYLVSNFARNFRRQDYPNFIFFFLLLLTANNSLAQNWNWVKKPVSGDNLFDHTVAADNNGSFYVASDLLYKFNSSGNLDWSRVIFNGSSLAHAVCVRAGAVYVTGEFSGQLVFGTDTLRSTKTNAYIVKYDTSGAVKWARCGKTIGHWGYGKSHSIAVDKLNNTYITGFFTDTIAFGVDTIRSAGDQFFLVKYDPNGTVVWTRTSTGNAIPQGNSITTDHSGNIYVTGDYDGYIGPVHFGSLTLNNPSNSELFLVKYDPNGNVIWAKGTVHNSAAGYSGGSSSVSADGSDNIYLAASYWAGTLTLGTHSLGVVPYVGGTCFVTKVRSDGTFSWIKEIVPLDSIGWQISSVSADSLKFGYLLVNTSSPSHGFKMKFDTDTFRFHRTSTYSTASAILQFDSLGYVQCGSMFSEGDENDGDAVAVDRSGRYVYIAGDISTSASVGSYTLTPPIGVEALLIGRWNPCNLANVGVQEYTSNFREAIIFPNPNQGIFNISLPNTDQKFKIDVYSGSGQLIFSEKLNSETTTIDLESEPDGLYLYRIISTDHKLIFSGKFIID